MRKILSVVAVLLASTQFVFAADKPATAAVPAAAPVAVTTPMMAAEKTEMGAVKSVSMADAAKGTKSEIVLTNAAAKDVNVLVTATTTLYDADAKAITLDKIAAGAKVSVVYTVTGEGVNEAKSIKVSK